MSDTPITMSISSDGTPDGNRRFGAAMNVGQAVMYEDIPATDEAMDMLFNMLMDDVDYSEACAAIREFTNW